MAEVDLRRLPEDEVVLQFGGRPNEVDAFTFSNSLVAFAEAIQEINRQISPETAVQVSIEGIGLGSFRAKINARRKPLSALWREVGKPVLIGVLTYLICHRILAPAPFDIKVNESTVVITHGDDRIIIPRTVYDATQKLAEPRQVEHHIARAFNVMENDPSVTDFGLAAGIHDLEPIVPVHRERFSIFAVPQEPETGDKRRSYEERTHLTIIKAIFQRGHRKWEFVWKGGVRISASIQDQTFFDKLARREFWFAQGDELDVQLRVRQLYDDANSVYINAGLR